MDIIEAGFLSSLLCPILFHVLMSQTAVTALLPAYTVKYTSKLKTSYGTSVAALLPALSS